MEVNQEVAEHRRAEQDVAGDVVQRIVARRSLALPPEKCSRPTGEPVSNFRLLAQASSVTNAGP